MQHFLNLDKCSCGAYRYLAIREHKRSYEVYLIHHLHNQNSRDQRRYSKLASIPKHRLNIHDVRTNQSNARTVTLTYEQMLSLRSLLKDIDSDVTNTDEELMLEEETETIPA